jgi:hypothetical protein
MQSCIDSFIFDRVEVVSHSRVIIYGITKYKDGIVLGSLAMNSYSRLQTYDHDFTETAAPSTLLPSHSIYLGLFRMRILPIQGLDNAIHATLPTKRIQ